MTLREIKKEIAKRTGKTFKESNMIIDSMMEIILEALVDSDVVELDPLGSLELKSLLPNIVDGEEIQRGSVVFRPLQETLNFLIKENLAMLEKEERE